MKRLVLWAILVICSKDVKSLKCIDSFGLGLVNCISVVDGSWSQWGSWSTCDSTCSRSRTRQCTDPKPQNGGKDCAGVPKETERCTGGLCGPCQSENTTSCNTDTGKCINTGSTWRCDCKQFFQNQPGNNQTCISIFQGIKIGKNFNTGQVECEKRGGYLATIFSQAENNALLKYFDVEDILMAWIGLKQTTKNQYKWATGETIQIKLSTGDAANQNEYANFRKGPNGDAYDKYKRDDRDCISIEQDGKWYDYPCSMPNYYVCKVIYNKKSERN